MGEESKVESLWTVEDMAVFLKMSPRTVWKRLGRAAEEPGSVPHLRFGRRIRFMPELIREWTARGCPPAAAFDAWRRQDMGKRKSGEGP